MSRSISLLEPKYETPTESSFNPVQRWWSREAKTWLSSRNVAGGTMSERTDRKTTAARKAGIVQLKIAANSHRLKYFLSSTITPTDTMSWNILFCPMLKILDKEWLYEVLVIQIIEQHHII